MVVLAGDSFFMFVVLFCALFLGIFFCFFFAYYERKWKTIQKENNWPNNVFLEMKRKEVLIYSLKLSFFFFPLVSNFLVLFQFNFTEIITVTVVNGNIKINLL